VHDVLVDEGRMDRLAAEYRRFSAQDTAGRSALYTEITQHVAEDRELLVILCELEPAKRTSPTRSAGSARAGSPTSRWG
jgi:hypothetical protein